ncbi:hypothetical protein JXA63_04110 [Candidatus Woesebacteria bacterium]|nr:hypothetical protein [Candidatus Woesebacteria bacterium]
MDLEKGLYRRQDGVPGGGDESQKTLENGGPPEAERNRMAYRQTEYGHEIGEETTIEGVLNSTRMFTARIIGDWYDHELPPPTYIIDNQIIPQIVDRRRKLTMDIPLGEGNYSQEDAKAGLVGGQLLLPATAEDYHFHKNELNIIEYEDRHYILVETDENSAYDKAKELSDQLELSVREIKAVQTVLNKLDEQDAFAGDVELYMVNAFQRLGKIRADSKHYAELLNLSESHKGFRPLGEKTQEAFNYLRESAEGRAIVEVGGEKMALPDVFGFSRNQGLMDLVIKKYIVPKLGYTTAEVTEDSTPREKALRDKEELDNYRAALTALSLFRHWDLDAYYSVGLSVEDKKGTLVSPGNLSKERLDDLELATSYTDSSKALHFELRRATEWGKQEEQGRRDHPRTVGPPSTLGCYPSLTTHALAIMSAEVQLSRKDNPQEKKVVRMSIEKRVFGSGEIDIREKDENKKEVVRTYTYDTVPLGDPSLWDNITILDGDQPRLVDDPDLDIRPVDTSQWERRDIEKVAERVMNFAMGAPTDAYEIPYKLQGYYAYKYMYAQFMRTDYKRLLDEVLNSDFLMKMNKPIDLGFNILTGGLGIDGKTANKLKEYMRVVFLGGLGASVIKNTGRDSLRAGKKMQNKTQVPGAIASEETIRLNILSAGLTTGFFNGIEEYDSPMKFEKDDKCLRLYNYIIDNRRAPTPYELKKSGFEGWFSDEELRSLLPLYPLEKWNED